MESHARGNDDRPVQLNRSATDFMSAMSALNCMNSQNKNDDTDQKFAYFVMLINHPLKRVS